MSLSVGIVGLPNAGKSTLFNALIKKHQAKIAVHPFTTLEPNRGTVEVPDQRLVQLSVMTNISEMVPVILTFIDIAGLIKDAHKGEGLGNQFLGHIREADMIIHVLRAFTNPNVPHIHEDINPLSDLGIVETELILADLELVNKQLEKVGKKITADQLNLFKKLQDICNRGEKIINNTFSLKERALLKDFFLLTNKPCLLVLNTNESECNKEIEIINLNGHQVFPICAKLEEELAELPWVEQRRYLKIAGIEDSALEKIIRQCYKMLDLITFYTFAGGKQVRAWSIKRNSSVIDAAAKIHSEFAEKFIKAEVIPFEKLLALGSWQKAKLEGKLRLVGRDYQVCNSDIIEIKHGN